MSDDLNRTNEVIKEGLPIEKHSCEGHWFEQLLGKESTESVWVTERICRVCGRVEKTREPKVVETFESIYKKFHGGE